MPVKKQVDIEFEGRIVASYPIVLAMLNGPQPTDADFEKEARRLIVDDGLLSAQQLEKARFSIQAAQ